MNKYNSYYLFFEKKKCKKKNKTNFDNPLQSTNVPCTILPSQDLTLTTPPIKDSTKKSNVGNFSFFDINFFEKNKKVRYSHLKTQQSKQ